ncbi:hypothetical protein ACFQ4K_32455 [Tistrella bauzanensis]
MIARPQPPEQGRRRRHGQGCAACRLCRRVMKPRDLADKVQIQRHQSIEQVPQPVLKNGGLRKIVHVLEVTIGHIGSPLDASLRRYTARSYLN